jgi:NCAIR mutase (PurE)-related protein
MLPKHLIQLLENYKNGTETLTSVESALLDLPYEKVGESAKIDHHRMLRKGHPEVINCQNKTIEHIKEIFESIKEHDSILMTRLELVKWEKLNYTDKQIKYDAMAKAAYKFDDKKLRGKVYILAAGTADIPVAKEAFITAQWLGAKCHTLYDVGVAGIHRLLDHRKDFEDSNCIVAIAGMEGAMPAVVAGLVGCPVIAVPASTGYGVSFNGVSALLTMLNSCVPNISVVNIDNGFGGGYQAALINRQATKEN